jgi:hypothetical protein
VASSRLNLFFYYIVINDKNMNLMTVYHHNFPISNSDRPSGKTIYVSGVWVCFVIDMMPYGMVRVGWCDIVLIAHM